MPWAGKVPRLRKRHTPSSVNVPDLLMTLFMICSEHCFASTITGQRSEHCRSQHRLYTIPSCTSQDPALASRQG